MLSLRHLWAFFSVGRALRAPAVVAVFLIFLTVPIILDRVVGMYGFEPCGSFWSGRVGGWRWDFAVYCRLNNRRLVR